jgi:predicted phosphodiesterase
MALAILSDIHGNREALDACLEDAYAQGADEFVFLGDLVGYGADPDYVVDTAIHFAAGGATVLKGNHDEAVLVGTAGMNSYASTALKWTADQLNPKQKAFLASLPMTMARGEALFVHADASQPAAWRYVTDTGAADRSLRATEHRVTFCGHVHRPQLYHKAAQKPPVCFIPKSGIPIPLAKSQKWLAVIGAVGQPRDEIPSAAYALYAPEAATLTYMRVGYDIERAARKIKEAGLPSILSARLFVGR